MPTLASLKFRSLSAYLAIRLTYYRSLFAFLGIVIAYCARLRPQNKRKEVHTMAS
jgi:hypothetical protein